MPASKTAGTKRKAAGSDANAAKSKSSSSSSPTAVYMVQCTRSSHAKHIPVERVFASIAEEKADLYGDNDDAYEQDAMAAQIAAAKYDGTWVHGTPSPGSSVCVGADCDIDRGVTVFRTLKAANAYAAEVWDELQENPPFYAEADESDSAVRKTKSEEGYVKYQRDQTFHLDADSSESVVACSTLSVQVVAARLM
jgi:hypothetical protein